MSASTRPHHRTRITSLLALTLAVTAAACDLGTDPPPSQLGSFTPILVQIAVEETLVPVQISAEASRMLILALRDLQEAGLVIDPAGSGTLLDGAHRLPALAAAPEVVQPFVDIPPELQDQVIVYDLSTGEFVPDPDRSGAPAGGMRVIYYALDGTGTEVRLPLVERGYIDLTDADAGGQSRLRSVIVNNETGSDITIADVVQAYALTGTATDSTETVDGAGFFSDGQTQINFALTASSTEAIGSDDASYDYDVSFNGPSGGFQFSWNGTFDSGAQQHVDTFGIDFDSSEHDVLFDMVSTNADSPFEGSGTGGLTVHGSDFADVELRPGGNLLFENPSGPAFSSNDRSQLRSLVVVMWLGGHTILSSLPLLIFV